MHCGHKTIERYLPFRPTPICFSIFYSILLYTLNIVHTQKWKYSTMCIVALNVSMLYCCPIHFAIFLVSLCCTSFEILSIEKAIDGSNGCMRVFVYIRFLKIHHFWFVLYWIFVFVSIWCVPCRIFRSVDASVILSQSDSFHVSFGRNLFLFYRFLRIQN